MRGKSNQVTILSAEPEPRIRNGIVIHSILAIKATTFVMICNVQLFSVHRTHERLTNADACLPSRLIR